MHRITDPSQGADFYDPSYDYDDDHYTEAWEFMREYEKEKEYYKMILENVMEEFYGHAPLNQQNVDRLLEELVVYFDAKHRPEDLNICRKPS